jgi:hypothetical protein
MLPAMCKFSLNRWLFVNATVDPDKTICIILCLGKRCLSTQRSYGVEYKVIRTVHAENSNEKE